MVDRIIMNTSGVRISRPTYDAATASPENMAMYSGMQPCIPLASNSAMFTGNGTRTFSFTNTSGDVPVVLLKSQQGIMPSGRTYYAMIKSPYNSVTIHNVDGVARTVEFKVLL